jgi:hypothetical protein
VDVTGAAFNLVLSATCTIYAWAYGIYGMNSFSKTPYFGIGVGGVDDTLLTDYDFSHLRGWFSIVRRVSGVTSGTKAIQLRTRMSASGDDVTIYSCRVMAFAVME